MKEHRSWAGKEDAVCVPVASISVLSWQHLLRQTLHLSVLCVGYSQRYVQEGLPGSYKSMEGWVFSTRLSRILTVPTSLCTPKMEWGGGIPKPA